MARKRKCKVSFALPTPYGYAGVMLCIFIFPIIIDFIPIICQHTNISTSTCTGKRTIIYIRGDATENALNYQSTSKSDQ